MHVLLILILYTLAVYCLSANASGATDIQTGIIVAFVSSAICAHLSSYLAAAKKRSQLIWTFMGTIFLVFSVLALLMLSKQPAKKGTKKAVRMTQAQNNRRIFFVMSFVLFLIFLATMPFIGQARKYFSELREQVQALELENSRQNAEIRRLYDLLEELRAKIMKESPTPPQPVDHERPCWLIKEDNRERHIKIFDIQISDDAFEVRIHDNSEIEAKIIKGNTDDALLKIVDPEFLNRPISPQVFAVKFTPFLDAGKNKKIREHSCRFMVDVYDATSADNKNGYKNRIRAIENIFYVYKASGKWD